MQFRYAIALEHRWSKQQIIEAYLNLVPLRGELVGIRAASLGLFGHAPDALDEAESAVVAALVRSPSASRSVVARRACSVMKRIDKARGVRGRRECGIRVARVSDGNQRA